MTVFTLSYTFTQRFPFPARDVFQWATAYDPRDIERLGKRGTRRVRRLAPDTVLLSDSFVGDDGRTVRKPKLVQLYADRLRWINTHIGGPNRHSQYIYEVVPDGPRASHLVFTGRQVIRGRAPGAAERARMERLSRADGVAMWRRLAAAMKVDLHSG